MTHISDLLIIISIIFLVFAFSSSLVIIFILSEKNKESKKKTNKYFRNYIMSLMLGLINATFSNIFSHIPSIMRIFSMLTLISAITSSFFLYEFSILLLKLEPEESSKKKIKIFVIIGLLIVFLPWNNFGTLSIYQTSGINIQPFTITYIIILSLIIEIKAIKASTYVIKKIYDPPIKIIYGWIHKGLIYNTWYIFGLILSLITYLFPLEFLNIIELIFTIAVFIAIIFIAIGIIYFYFAVTLPERPLRKIYNRYSPMWEDKALNVYEEKEKDEEIDRIIRNLKTSLFE